MKSTLNNRRGKIPYIFYSVWYLFVSNTQPTGIIHSVKNHSPPKQLETFQKVRFVNVLISVPEYI